MMDEFDMEDMEKMIEDCNLRYVFWCMMYFFYFIFQINKFNIMYICK